MSTTERSPGRVLAPLALVAFALALVVIVASGGGDGTSSSGTEATKQEQRDLGVTTARREAQRAEQRQAKLDKGVYVVKTGDTLGAIAVKTGVTVEKLQQLNPDLDPQALVSGQKIKLRE